MGILCVGKLGQGVPAVAVIMAGGSGTRFWPLSRSSRPKQFLPLAGDDKSLIQMTSERVQGLVGSKGVMVVTAENQKDLVCEQLPEACVLVEPVPRNTAACVGYAAKKVLLTIGDVPMLCLPADHVVYGTEEILSVYRKALEIAQREDVLVTIGIKPNKPETGYGYIHRGSSYKYSHGSSTDAFHVQRFVEKPDTETAKVYLESGEYFWNSGMFIWRPSVILREIAATLPDLSQKLDQIGACLERTDGYDEAAELYAAITPISIDYGVLEKSANVVMLPGDSFRWSDVGSWDSWAETMSEIRGNKAGNVFQGDVMLLDSIGCTVVGQRKLIAGVGLENLVIIDTEDALLVCPRSRAQDVKNIVDLLKENKRNNLL